MKNPFAGIARFFRARAAAVALYEQNEALQDTLVLNYQERQRQLYNFHHIMAAAAIQNGGQIHLTEDVMDAGSEQLVELVPVDDNKGLLIKLKPAGAEETCECQ